MNVFRRRSSGDLIADRRFGYGEALARKGDHGAAIELFEQAIERVPNWPPVWRALARARLARFDITGACAALRECLRLDPADELGAGLELTMLDAGVTVDTAPAAYVAALFNAYAPTFEKALVERLAYSTPTALARLLAETAQGEGPRRFARALDLGCGTGLAGDAIRRNVGYLEGVDLSAGMLDIARSKGVYDALIHGDILSCLLAGGPAYDLILAADVFSYIGDLENVFKAAASRLSPGGILAISVEKAPDEASDWSIRQSLRFAHSARYLRRLAAESGFSLVALRQSVLRKDRGADVDGLLVVLASPACAGHATVETPAAAQDAAAQTPLLN